MSEVSGRPRRSLLWRYAIVGLLLLPAVVLKAKMGLFADGVPIVISESVLPEKIGPWAGDTISLTDEERSMLLSPASAQKIYTNKQTGERVQVLLLQVNNTQNAHDPKICMSGSDFDLEKDEQIKQDWATRSGKVGSISRAVFAKGSTRLTMFYWLQTADGTIADMSVGFKWAGFVNAFRGKSTKGVAVRVLCLPDRANQPAQPDSARKLWHDIDAQVGVEDLARRM